MRCSEYSCELNDQEVAVLRQMALGKRNAEIAATLGMTFSQVKNHKVRIFNRLGARNSVDAIRIAWEDYLGGRWE